MKKVNSVVSLFCVLFYLYNLLLINAQGVENDQNFVSDCKYIAKDDEKYEMAENLIGEILDVLNIRHNIKYILKDIICLEMSDNKNLNIRTLFVWDENTTNCRIRVRIRTVDNKVFINCQNGVEKSFIYPHPQNRDNTKMYLYNSENLFNTYKKEFNKNYESTIENKRRYRIFKENLHRIYKLNQMEMGSATYGVTEFSDMTPLEFRKRTGLLPIQNNPNNIKNPIGKIPNFKLPREFDWRTKNAVTQVKNQGSCGSCWAFSTIGNIESLHAIKTGLLEEYSEQELVDCDNVDNGCNGGLMDNAYKAIEKLGGLELESEYPYEAHREKCQFNRTLSHVKINGAVDLPQNETALALWLLANGPIAVGINANAMQFYRGGVSHPWHTLCRGSKIDHGVLIVGFGITEYPLFNKTLPYWIVKNSWGSQWGEQGYYRVFRGDNTCGISSMASSAVL